MKNAFIGAIFLMVLFLFATPGIAQENFQPGYLIKLNGDTLKGYVDYRNWESNPKSFFFKESPEQVKTKFSTSNVLSFGVADEIYSAAIVQLNKDSNKLNSLTYSADIIFNSDTVFLQQLVGGQKSLFYHRELSGDEHFFIKTDDGFQLLLFKKYFKELGNEKVIALNSRYIGQLNLYLSDCRSIQKELSNIEYEQKSLVKLFSQYYKCVGKDNELKKRDEKVKVYFGGLAGISSTRIAFKSSMYPYLTEVNYPRSNRFTGGIFMEVVLRRNQGKWSLNNELLYTSFESKGEYEHYENETTYSKIRTAFGATFIKMNNMVRYKYPLGKFQAFVNVGISHGLPILVTNQKWEETSFFGVINKKEGPAIQNLRQMEQGYLVGAGLNFSPYSFEFRYDNGNGLSKINALRSSTSRLSILLAYKF